jgi:hypothetical protein
MGLDITAYSYLRPARDVEVEEDGSPKDWRRFWRPGASMEWSEKHWPGRGEGIDPRTIYDTYHRFGFRAGSYSGYGEWRDWLGTIAEDDGSAFRELVEFADNEGVIGPVVARKLANDFRVNITKAVARAEGGMNPWFLDQYVRWWVACMMASSEGAIDFH